MPQQTDQSCHNKQINKQNHATINRLSMSLCKLLYCLTLNFLSPSLQACASWHLSKHSLHWHRRSLARANASQRAVSSTCGKTRKGQRGCATDIPNKFPSFAAVHISTCPAPSPPETPPHWPGHWPTHSPGGTRDIAVVWTSANRSLFRISRSDDNISRKDTTDQSNVDLRNGYRYPVKIARLKG